MSKSAKAIIPGRSCDGCTLCCKVMAITELEKPQGVWCPHVKIGSGCGIYDRRPSECAEFYCGYRLWPAAGEHWFPARSKMVIASELDGARIAVHVDPGRPTAWRSKPFYDDLKQWAELGTRENIQVIVCLGNRVTVIFPDRDIDLGPVSADERIISGETEDAAGVRRFEAFKVRADDPRVAGRGSGAFRRRIDGLA